MRVNEALGAGQAAEIPAIKFRLSDWGLRCLFARSGSWSGGCDTGYRVQRFGQSMVIRRQQCVNAVLPSLCCRRLCAGRDAWRCPDRIREMPVIAPARNDMPMHMRHHIAERGEIDFVWCEHIDQCLFDRIDRAHQHITLGRRQLGHFGLVGMPDDARKTGIVRVSGVDDAKQWPSPQDGAAVFAAERAISKLHG